MNRMAKVDFFGMIVLLIILRPWPPSMPSSALMMTSLALLNSTPSTSPASALFFVNLDKEDLGSAQRAAEKSREMCNVYVRPRTVSMDNCKRHCPLHIPRALHHITNGNGLNLMHLLREW